MTTRWRKHLGMIALALTAIAGAAGCHAASAPAPDTPPAISDAAPDLDAELAKAATANEAVLVLITEPGHGDAAAAAKVVRGASRSDDLAVWQLPGIVAIHLDLAVSRNRAAAARYHVTETPLLLTLTSHAVIVGRCEGAITTELLVEQFNDFPRRRSEIDATLAKLQAAVTANPGNAAAQMALADFFRGHQNQREAIPHLAAVAHAASAETTLRVRAWVDLARAHRWVAEPEKGRHEANDLIATLGPTVPEARAGGSLLLGLQDAAAKRFALARQEFQAAIDAAPGSAYADEARAAMAALPREGA